MNFVRINANGEGRTVFDDGVARAGDIGNDRFVLECAGRAVEFDVHQLPEAVTFLIRQAGGRLSLLEAARVILEDVEARIDVG